MKQWIGLALLVFVGTAGRRDDEERNERRQSAAAHPATWGPAGYYPPPQPPVIVLTGQTGAQGQVGPGWSAPESRAERRFKVVGDQEQWSEEW